MSQKLLLKIGDRGQTSVEYVLMLAVVVALTVSVMGIVRSRVLGPGGECTAGNRSILCTFETMFNRSDGFRYFSIRR